MPISQIFLQAQAAPCSRLIFGAWRMAQWQMTTFQIRELIDRCLEWGITSFDHADIYGDYTCEGLFGAALAEAPALREQIQIIDKCGIRLVSDRRPQHQMHDYDTSAAHIIASVNHSLKQLHTDYLDVLLIHRPDPLMDADDVAQAFIDLHQAGKVRHFGVSNFTPSQFNLLASRLPFPLVTNQVEISVLHLDPFTDGTLDQCQQLRIAPMAWSPLAGGRLFQSQNHQPQNHQPQNDRTQRVRAALQQVGEQLNGATTDQVAFAWLLTHPAKIIPILGTGKIDRIQSAVAAEKLRLSREQWFTIWTASTGAEVP
ncbi:aldo/keto reductase [Leptolyngbya ohadii]|uniref:aldo/keto reductase n=1 Tax=Leptolyngbya ohadii TaxID=1962290 RepID=UPI000B59FC1A|nr:aldo/keto reductase [Leptolyngbya ohadii]